MTAILKLFRLSLIIGLTICMFGIWVLGDYVCRLARAIRWQTVWRRWWHHTWAKSVLVILRIRVSVQGEISYAPELVVSNHLSYLDIIVYIKLFNGHFVAKKDVRSWPLIGYLGRCIGTIFINRESKRDILGVVTQMTHVVESGRQLILFPEGTSSNGITVLPFKSSLFDTASRSNMPIRPICIDYTVPDSDHLVGEHVCWWGDMTLIPHIWQFLSLSSVTAHVCVGRDLIRGKDRKVLSRECHSIVMEMFQNRKKNVTI